MSLLDRHRILLIIFVVVAVSVGWRVVTRERPEPMQGVGPPTRTSVGRTAETRLPNAVSSPNGQVVDTAPAETGTLRGRVIDAVTHQPIGEFRIEFFAEFAATPTPGARIFQAADGRFSWPNVPSGRWGLIATANGYQRFELDGVLMSKGATTPEIVIPLRAGFAVSGRVYDELTGSGIEGATVSYREAHVAEFDSDWRRRPHAETDRNGAFELDGVPAGRISFSASSKDYASKQVIVSVGSEMRALQIGMSAGGSIAGRMTAADGTTAIAGRIVLSNLDRLSSTSSDTGTDGAFAHEHLAPGRYRLSGSADSGYAELDVTLGQNERRQDVILRIKNGAVVRGTVTGLGSSQLALVSIIASSEDGIFGENEVRVDERGGYVMSGVRAGRLLLAADLRGRMQLSRTIAVPPESQLIVDFHFPRGSRLYGRITRGGKPLPGVDVQPEPLAQQDLFTYATRASPQGAYSFEGLQPGDYRLIVGGHISPVVKVTGDTEFDIALPLRADLAGQVTEASGAPIVGAFVDLRPSFAGQKVIPRASVTDHFGRFSIQSLQPGDYVVTVYKPEYAMHRERLTFSSAISDRTFRLQQDRGVDIRVRDVASGEALRAVFVVEIAAGIQGRDMRIALDDEGRGTLPSALAGSPLSFRAAGFQPIDIRAWNGRELDLRLVRIAPAE